MNLNEQRSKDDQYFHEPQAPHISCSCHHFQAELVRLLDISESEGSAAYFHKIFKNIRVSE